MKARESTLNVSRKRAGWLTNQPLVVDIGSSVAISVVFSWDAHEAERRARYYRGIGRSVRVGGPAVRNNPDWFVEPDLSDWPALKHHNPRATFTSRGCIRKCGFCAVPRIEGDLVELDDWEPAPVVCDNNLLACSLTHFDRVVDRLKGIEGVDFEQGLDARLLTDHHALRITELDMRCVRLAWDSRAHEKDFMAAWKTLCGAGFPKSKIWVYVLIGFRDAPNDALYRLDTIAGMGGVPFPMRFQPLDARRRNEYVDEHWEGWLLNAYMRYWSRLRYTRAVPFNEWLDTYRYRSEQEKQASLL